MTMDAPALNSAISDALLPGPRARTRFGRALTQLRLLIDPLQTVASRFDRFGDAYRVEQQGGDLYVFRHPDAVRDVLVTHASAFDKQHGAFQRLSQVLGDALLTSDGERWRRQRRLVQPAFARPRMQEYAAVMVEEAERTAASLAQTSRADVSREMNALTLRVVSRTLFGQAPQGAAAERTRAAMLELNRWFGLPPQLLALWPGAGQRFARAQRDLNDTIARLVESRRAALAEAATPPTDLLSALMSARDEDGEALGAEELRDQLLTLYLAGHETTSHALTWTLYLLSLHPEASAELDAEHRRVLNGRAPSFADLAALPYTESVIKEALRLYPPAFLIPRHAHADATVAGQHVPRGSEVILWIYHLQRDPRFFPEPERFRPERFAGADEAARPRHAYVPFGAGQRACIGQSFAMLEAQLILATLAPRLAFRYARRRAPRCATGVTLAPRGGMPMYITRKSS
jgi:cytochrome P450